MAYLFQCIDNEIHYCNQCVAVLADNICLSLRDEVTAAIESYESDLQHTKGDLRAEYEHGWDEGFEAGNLNADPALVELENELEEARETIARLNQRIDELLALEASQIDSDFG